ncbi:MAG: GFA family protein [Alphaproteobacteria bacterium]|nr:GFA family protein [Alphaproteobacteria bacterium]
MKNQGRCLCGSLTWEISAEPFYAFNCHCKMCQKAHGTAFGTYWFVKPEQFHWTSDTDTLVQYGSSKELLRSSCDTCGSVVPYGGGSSGFWVAPGGCHDDGRGSDYDIFVVDSSPWHDLTGNLPRHDAYPPETGFPSFPNPPAAKPVDGAVRGGCMCGAVGYLVTEPMKTAYYCHCSRCRQGRAAPFASNGFTSLDGVTFTKGEDNLKSYKVPGAKHFTQVFCKTCSALMPRRDTERGVTVIPLGSLDDDPGFKPVAQIFTADKCKWHEITGPLPRFEAGPG